MKKILVVDDDPIYTKTLQVLLEKNHYQVKVAHDGEEGIALARQEKPDLIVLDILMPKLDGTEAYGIIKNDPELENIPVLFLTAVLSKEEEAPRANVEESYYHVIAKPIDNQDFITRVKAILRE